MTHIEKHIHCSFFCLGSLAVVSLLPSSIAVGSRALPKPPRIRTSAIGAR